MEPKFMISEVFGTSWKYTKSQIWVLVGLFIGYFILSSIISKAVKAITTGEIRCAIVKIPQRCCSKFMGS